MTITLQAMTFSVSVEYEIFFSAQYVYMEVLHILYPDNLIS